MKRKQIQIIQVNKKLMKTGEKEPDKFFDKKNYNIVCSLKEYARKTYISTIVRTRKPL